MSQLLKAKEFAADAHKGDTYGEHTYIKHLNDVHNSLVHAGIRDELPFIVAWLHDTIEDTHVRYEDVHDHFGKRVADVTYLVTDKRGKNRKERHEATYPLIAEHPVATVVKWADRASNIMMSQHSGKAGHFDMYKKEHAYFKATLSKKFGDAIIDEAIEHLSGLIDRLISEGPIIAEVI